jgi:hypothetical protein
MTKVMILSPQRTVFLNRARVDSSASTIAGPGPKKRGVTHVATTSKRITFREVQLRPKDKTSVTTTQLPRPEAGGSSILLDEEGFMEEDEEADVIGGDIAMDDDDDALEYVEFNPQNQPEAGPSRQPPATPTAVPIPISPASSSPPPSPSLSAPFASFLSSPSPVVVPPTTRQGKGKASAEEPSTSLQDVDDAPSDPAFRIDRLVGISPPLTRTPRGSKKAATVNPTAIEGGSTATPGSNGSTTAKEKGKQKAKGKGKGKEKEDDGNEMGMDTTPGTDG